MNSFLTITVLLALATIALGGPTGTQTNETDPTSPDARCGGGGYRGGYRGGFNNGGFNNGGINNGGINNGGFDNNVASTQQLADGRTALYNRNGQLIGYLPAGSTVNNG